MKQKRDRTLVAVALLITAVACAAFFITLPPTPLTPKEASFAGTWNHDLSTDGMIFNVDRTFQTEDGEFEGKWWISNNELKMKMWRADVTVFSNDLLNQLAAPVVNAWDSFNADIDSWELTIDDDEGQAELDRPGNGPEKLHRSN